LLSALLIACGDGRRGDSGIAVGNPGFSVGEPGVMLATAGHTEALALSTVDFSAKQAILTPCAGGRRVPLGGSEGGSEGWSGGGLRIPEGEWCGLELKSLRLFVEGEGPDGRFAFDAAPRAFALTFEAPPLAERPSLLVLGGADWLQPSMFQNSNPDGTFDEDSEEVAAILAAMGPSTLLLDEDGDGAWSPGDSPVADSAPLR
jgi:hypothetical protein